MWAGMLFLFMCLFFHCGFNVVEGFLIGFLFGGALFCHLGVLWHLFVLLGGCVFVCLCSRSTSPNLIPQVLEWSKGRLSRRMEERNQSPLQPLLHTAPEPAWNKEDSIHYCCLMVGICYMSTTPPSFNPHIISSPAAWASLTKLQRSVGVGV